MSSNLTSDRIREIYKSRNNLLAILKQQGYAVEAYECVGITDIAIMAEHGQLDMTLTRGGTASPLPPPASSAIGEATPNGGIAPQPTPNGGIAPQPTPSGIGIGKKLYVRYNVMSTFRTTNALSDLVDDLYTIDETLGPDDELIVVAQDDPNDKLMKLMEKMWIQDNTYVRVIGLKRLQFNILEHALVPQHTILSPEDRAVILKKYNVTNAMKQLPVISRFDPVANVIGIRPGQVCEIQRSSRTTITANYYRVCV
jgi:DNA-directed RNA polymerase subunit H (RpoH/RPB5)